MTQHTDQDPTPYGFFKLEELEVFRNLEGEQLADVNYYFWHNVATPEQRFLLYVEVLFASENALIFTSGEDSEEIKVTEATALIAHARTLMERNGGQPAVRQLPASASALWMEVSGAPLQSIQLSKDPESNLYMNDALLLDFGEKRILVALNEHGGLSVGTA